MAMMFTAVLAALLVLPLAAQAPERLDLDAIYKIKEEGFQRSQVMQIAHYLTDVHGPRLTNSPSYRRAGEWAVAQLGEWGISNPRLDMWGPFGRGWENERFAVHVVEPVRFAAIGAPLAWSPGTDGPMTAEVVNAVIASEEDFDKLRGKLRGKFVLSTALRTVQPEFEPGACRFTDEQLAERAAQPVPTARTPVGGPPFALPANFAQLQRLAQRRRQFYQEEGVAVVIEASTWDKGVVRVGGVPGGQAARMPNTGYPLPTIMLSIEHYGRIYRLLESGIPVRMEVDVHNRFYDDDLDSFNVMGEIPGTDKADEVVMLGAHFDSWHSGTGATDNGAGSIVMLEAMRILKATGLPLRRTVRLGLWGGEEQGLLGSRAYVSRTFAELDPQTREVKPKPAHAKFAAYFNIDNGTGKIRGIYAQGNEAIVPIFERWFEPFQNLGATTVSIRNTGGTDHLAFDAVGLPGFQFIQDQLEYSTRTHHSNMDTYERLQEADLKQIAVIVASFVYHAANRPELMPRKPLPRPQPRTAGGPPQF
jgi:carboxypeptidase Q